MKLRTNWGKWISIFLLFSLFNADAQAYVPYVRSAMQYGHPSYVPSAESVSVSENRIRFNRNILSSDRWNNILSKALNASSASIGSHSHIPVSVQVDTTRTVGEIPYQSVITPTGGVTYTVPVEVAPGRGGMQPQINITYNSQGGNSALGHGWGIGGLSVISKVAKNLYYNGMAAPVSLTTGDALVLDGVRLLSAGMTNQFEPEQGNMRITGNVYDGDYRSFTVEYPNGMVGTYGFPSGTTKQLSFPITRLQDAQGNYMDFTYELINNQYYVTRIAYGAHTSSAAHLAEVVFTYANRSDASFVYEAGREVRFSRLLSKIECKNGSETLHTYTFTYQMNNGISFLQSLGCDNLNPLQFYYGYADNANGSLQYDSHVLFPYFDSNVDIVASKFKMHGGEEDDGLIVYPDKNPYVQYGNDRYESGYASDQSLIVYGHVTDFSTPLPMEFTAGAGFQCMMAGDVDGRSGDELLKINNTVVNGNDRLTVSVYKYNAVTTYGLANTFTFNSTPAKSGSFWPKRYLLGDFNGDGTVELLAVSLDKPLSQSNLRSKVFLFNPDTNTTYYNASTSLYLNSTDQLIPMDVDGDGKTEICHINSSQATVYGFQVSSSGVYSLQELFTEPTLRFYYLRDRCLLAGDVNGDGKCDLIASPRKSYTEEKFETIPVNMQIECTNCDFHYVLGVCPLCGTDVEPSDRCVACDAILDSDGRCPYHGSSVYEWVSRYYNYGNTWTVFYSTGSGFVEDEQNICELVDGAEYLLQDVNLDGCADLVHYYIGWVNVHLADDGRLPYYSVSKGLQTSSDEVTLVSSNVFLPNRYNFLLALHGDTFFKMYFTKNETKQRFLTGMTSSLGVTQHNYYQRLNDTSQEEGYDVFYDDGYVSPSSLPYESYNGPLWAVSRQDVYAEGEQLSSVAYNYKGGVLHRQGLGFRGFTEIHTQDLRRDRTRVAKYAPLQYGVPESVETDESKETYTYDVNVSSNRKLTANMTGKVFLDKLAGTEVTGSYSYDSYGNCLSEVLDYSECDSLPVLEECRTHLYLNQPTTGRYLIGLPVEENRIFERGDEVWHDQEEITYQSNTPLPLKRITRVYDSSETGYKTGETRYTYDTYGNVQTCTHASYNSTVFVGDTYTYDSNGRYLSTMTDGLGRTTTYSTYNKWGKPASSINFLGKQTTYAYDASGRTITTISPEGITQSVSYLWNPGKGVFGILKSVTGCPDELVCYDALNREVRTGQQRFDGSWLYVDKEYDAYGRLERESMPFKEDTATQWTVYTYDGHDRLTGISEPSGKQTTYSYSGTSVSTTDRGITTVRTKDASGQLVKVSDPSGEAFYHYRADGQLSDVEAPGNVVTSFEYDDYGRRTKLTDPSAGTQTYAETNHTDGSRTTTQTDAKGLTTTVNYDAHGRVTSIERPEFNTTYTYDTLTKELQSEVSTNGTKKEYTYDAYGRLNTAKETVDNVWLQKSYTYSEGNVSKVSYSSSKEGSIGDEHLFYANGTLHEVKLGATSVWKLTAENALGQPTEAVTGPLTRTYGYTEYGLPILRKAGNLQHFTYDFNATTDNLAIRTDSLRNNTETFTYDSLHRLTGYGTETVTYAANGNIESKSDAGNLSYTHASKPYAVTGAMGTGINQTYSYNAGGDRIEKSDAIQQRLQEVTYNSQQRPVMLMEGGNTATFLYDASGDRKKMTVTQDGTVTRTKYYLGDGYETDDTKTWLYINGNAYSSPIIYVKENNQWKIYYICRDYLGSITHLVNAEGTLVQELSYDAWGRLRNPQTREVYGADEQPVLMFDRGYTGHEHLSLFGLIHMNARLYDPLLGRFLSPDPYVQMPDHLQNLNRYSYCLNNPLAYVDETGEIWWFVAAAFVGAAINVATHWDEIKAGGWSAGIAYAVVGGAAGALGSVAGVAVASSIGISGFVGGSIIGAAGGAASGFTLGSGNTIVEGGGIGDILSSGAYGAVGGAVSGAVTGGVVGGASSYFRGENVWTGSDIAPGRNAFSLKNTPKLNIEGQPVRIGGSIEQDPLLNKGQMSPKAKGDLGVQDAIEDFRTHGGKVYSQEVTVELDGVRTRFDFVGELNGELHLFEVKNGINAGFTPNQQINLPKYLMNKPTLIPRGVNALKVPHFKELVPYGQSYQGNYIIIIRHYF